MSQRVKFVSYDGRYPNRCRGSLVLSVDGKEVRFPDYCLNSGGSITNNYENVNSGPWTVSEWPEGFPEELKEEATEVINNNAKWGCCGGCI